jgi:TatD DNase family protein
MLVDSHCHIPLIEHELGAEGVINNALENGVAHMLVVAIDLDSYPEVRKLAEEHDCISASVGVHPNAVIDTEPTVEQLCALAQHTEVVALGETGLDYYRSQGDCEWQRQRFRTHIRAARVVRKPLIIHCRNAGDDVLRILTEEQAEDIGGVMHCFADDWRIASRAMELNFLISFSGIVTFKNAGDLKDIARRVPLDQMLVETDAPYLAPVPYRGKQNQPAYSRYVAEHIAALRQLDYATVAAQTTANFRRLFTLARVAA